MNGNIRYILIYKYRVSVEFLAVQSNATLMRCDTNSRRLTTTFTNTNLIYINIHTIQMSQVIVVSERVTERTS
jgi:hypothetical protein